MTSKSRTTGGPPPPAETPLDRWLDESPRSWRAILDVFLDVGEELATAHGRGQAHPDVRIDNVVVTADGRARLRDLAPRGKDKDADAAAADPVAPAGLRTAAVSLEQRLAEMRSTEAAAYLAPEEFKGWVSDARSVQFSYCVALYRALYRQAPFDHDWAVSQVGAAASRRTPLGSVHFDLVVRSLDRASMVHLAREVLGGNLRPAPEDSEVPGWVEQILRRGLQADPDDRFESMEQLLEAVTTAFGAGAKGRKVSRYRDAGKWAVIAGLGVAVLLAILAKVAGWTP